jgi:hypothetical protein
MLGAALTVGVTPIEAKEIVYQAMPYVGMTSRPRLTDWSFFPMLITEPLQIFAVTRPHEGGRLPRTLKPIGCSAIVTNG